MRWLECFGSLCSVAWPATRMSTTLTGSVAIQRKVGRNYVTIARLPVRRSRFSGVVRMARGQILRAVLLATPGTPGVTWVPGINRNSTFGCKVRTGRHPQPSCRCGIRVVQSMTVLRAFARNQEPRIGPLVAYAECNVWGRLAPHAPDDDWRYTLRAEFAEIAGPLHLAPTHATHADALAGHYGVEVQT